MGFNERDYVNRNRFMMGIIIFAVFMILSGSVILFKRWNSSPAQINGREPLTRLGYCSSLQSKPCIASFSLAPGETMVINVLTTNSFPDFYLQIKQDGIENT